MTTPLSQRLANAWKKQGEAMGQEMETSGEQAQEIIQEALLEYSFQNTFREAMALLTDEEKTGSSLLEREAERFACLSCWTESARPGGEMVLLALPCNTNAGHFAHWLQSPAHRGALGKILVEQLALRWALPVEHIERLILFPAPVDPEAIASLSSDGRRRLMEEMVQREPQQSGIFHHLSSSLIPPQEADLLSLIAQRNMGDGGLFLFAVGVNTGWSEHEISDPSDHLREMALDLVPPESLQLFEEAWMDRWAQLPDAPLLTHVPQPTSLTSGLMQLLMAKVMSTRLMAEDSEQLLDHIEQENDLGLTPVLHFEASPSVDDPSRMNIQAMTSNGSLPAIEVSYHWALTNGPHALQVLLAEAFGMSEEPHASFRQSAPMESEPLHPGWKRALPPAPGLH